uniref:Uncharacterized protein n=1 Tax=Anguilla anguilla TaxID=7936 RepID=A0A0E9QJX6_ANGAN
MTREQCLAFTTNGKKNKKNPERVQFWQHIRRVFHFRP